MSQSRSHEIRDRPRSHIHRDHSRPSGGLARDGRAGRAAGRFAWDEFFYAEHHNPHTQKAYMGAVKRFLAWAEGRGWSCPPSRRAWSGNTSSAWAARPPSETCTCRRYAASSTGWCNRHVVILNPAASVRGVKEQVIEGKTPEITVEQARTLLAARSDNQGHRSRCVGLRDRAILATLAYTACRAGAVAKLRLGDFQRDGSAIRAAVPGEGRQEPGNPGAARSGRLYPGLSRGGGHRGRGQGSPLFRAAQWHVAKQLTGNAADQQARSASWSSGG